MNSFMKSIIQKKLQHLTTQDITLHAKQSNVKLTLSEAELIQKALTQRKYDIFDPGDQNILLGKLSAQLSPAALDFINKTISEWF